MNTISQNPNHPSLLRRAAVSGILASVALLPSACKEGVSSIDVKPAASCEWDVKISDNLIEIAISTTRQDATTDQIQQGIDDIMDANRGKGAKLQSPSEINPDNDILITDEQCKTYETRVKDGSLEDRYLDRVTKLN